VRDGDNFHLYHTPSIGWHWPLKFRRIPDTGKGALFLGQRRMTVLTQGAALKGGTIHIRIAGVDAPEGARADCQLSRAWLESKIQGRMIWCQLLRKDRSSRIVRLLIPIRFVSNDR
jgi:endonuclease YncB( thermonuclease family)